jgi:peptidoglycan/xylan/chitin deacetylase (PgdA/CDA1 family)
MVGIVPWSALAAFGAGWSLRWNLLRLPDSNLPILMYHNIGRAPSDCRLRQYWVSVKTFRQQMSHLNSAGYKALTLRDVMMSMENGIPLHPRSVVITFDDGLKNCYTNAFPVLRALNYRATVFIVSNNVGHLNYWDANTDEPPIALMNWNEIQEIHGAGWEVGSHTLTHPVLTKLSRDEAYEEMKKSRNSIEAHLGATVSSFSYPYGDGEDHNVIWRLCKSAGYRMAVGVKAGPGDLSAIRQNPFAIPRVFVRGGESMFRFKLQLKGIDRFRPTRHLLKKLFRSEADPRREDAENPLAAINGAIPLQSNPE